MWRQLKNKWLAAAVIIGGGLLFVAPSVVALTNIEANVCADFVAPAVSSPTAAVTTEASSYVIEGTGEPGMTVDIAKGSSVVSSVTVLPDGTFAMSVPLDTGDNTFSLREANSCTTKQATVPVIHRTVPQQPPTGHDAGEPPAPTVVSPSVSLPVSPLVTPPAVPARPPKGSSGLVQPTITSPLAGTVVGGSGRVWVAGKAKPGSRVTVYVNNQSVASLLADSLGNYGALIGLRAGKNTIQVRSELGGKSSLSGVIEVTYIPEKKAAGEDSMIVRIIKVAAVIVIPLAVIGGGGWIAAKKRWGSGE